MRLFIMLFLLFWSPWHWTMTHKSSKPEKHLQSISELVYSRVCLHGFITFPTVKPVGLQRKHGGEILFRKASPPTMHPQDGGGHMRDLGIHLLYPLLKSRAPAHQGSHSLWWEFLPLTLSPFISTHNRVQGATKANLLACFKYCIQSVAFFPPL